MTAVVVDATTAVRWFTRERESDAAVQFLDDEEWRLIAPELLRVEAANIWWKKVRACDMSPIRLHEAVGTLNQLGIEWVPNVEVLPKAARLAVRLRQPVHDCVYLATALDRGVPLAAGDRRLRQLAKRLDIATYPRR